MVSVVKRETEMYKKRNILTSNREMGSLSHILAKKVIHFKIV